MLRFPLYCQCISRYKYLDKTRHHVPDKYQSIPRASEIFLAPPRARSDIAPFSDRRPHSLSGHGALTCKKTVHLLLAQAHCFITRPQSENAPSKVLRLSKLTPTSNLCTESCVILSAAFLTHSFKSD